MSNQQFYPQQDPSENPNNTTPASNRPETEYGNEYSSEPPRSNPFENVRNNNSPYSTPPQSSNQQSANSYGSPSFSNDSYNDPYANSATSANSYGHQDPYSTSAASANSSNYENSGNSWNGSNQSYAQANPQAYQTQPQQDLNIKALLGLIFSFFFFPAGLILSWLGFRETKDSADKTGRIMSIIGLSVSGIQTVFFILWVLLFLFFVIIGSTGAGM